MFKTKKHIALHRTLARLARDETIHVCALDKGTGVCILIADDYYKKLDSIVDDTFKFEKMKIYQEVKNHPLLA